MIRSPGKKGLSLAIVECLRASFRPEWIFVALALAAGLPTVFVTGPFQAPDEFNHFYRIYQIAEGQLFAQRIGDKVGGWLPLDVSLVGDRFHGVPFNPESKIDLNTVKQLVKQPFVRKDRVFVIFPNTALYPPIAYAPQALGMFIGKISGFSALALMYMGRIMGLLFWVAVVWTAIRVTPVLKWTIFLLALMPMHLFLAAALSADPLINAASILLVALILRAMTRGTEFVRAGVGVTIVVLDIFLAMAKFVYMPLLGLLILIPARKFRGWPRKALFCLTVLAAGLAATMLWGFESKKLYVDVHGANSAQQLALILADPCWFAKVLLKTFDLIWFFLLEQFIGVLGWLDTRLPTWIMLTYPIALTATALLESGKEPLLGIRGKTFVGLMCMFGSLLIPTAMYLTWTKPGAGLIDGMQGRYFIPFALPALLLLHNHKLRLRNTSLLGIVLSVYCAVICITTCLTLYTRYYG
jgi:uncharacterized membrane protein